jgi:hypothetical protein
VRACTDADAPAAHSRPPNRRPSVSCTAQGRLGEDSSRFKPDVVEGGGGGGGSRIVFEIVEVVEQAEDVEAMDALLHSMYGVQVPTDVLVRGRRAWRTASSSAS